MYIGTDIRKEIGMSTIAYTLNGTALLYEGARALDALKPLLQTLENADLAEFRLYENRPAEAVICDDFGCNVYVWNFESWVVETDV